MQLYYSHRADDFSAWKMRRGSTEARKDKTGQFAQDDLHQSSLTALGRVSSPIILVGRTGVSGCGRKALRAARLSGCHLTKTVSVGPCPVM